MPTPSPQLLSPFDEYAARFVERAEAQWAGSPDLQYVQQCLLYARRLFDAGLPVIFDAEHLAALVGYKLHYVKGAAYCADRFYRRFSIEKRSGGTREIAEPLPSLKEIQHWIYSNVLLAIPVSPVAKAFVPGVNLRDSARLHRAQKFVLRVDIKDFFPSVSRGRVFGVFRGLGYSSDVAGLLSRLCCLNDSLPQGGVCSPYLSNIILRALDKRIFSFCRRRGLRYTRYADDLTISGEDLSGSVVRFIYGVIRSEGFEVNEKKTAVMRSGGRQSVVGVVVNEKLNAPREFRRKLRQQSYFIEKHGLDGHLDRIDEKRSGAVLHYLGKCSHALSLNATDRDALGLRGLLTHTSRGAK